MRKKLQKRLMSVLLVITLLFSALPLTGITAFAATKSGITIGTFTSMKATTFKSKIKNYSYVLLFYKSDAPSTYTEAKFKELYQVAKDNNKGVGVILTQSSNTKVFDFLTTNNFQFDYPIYLRYTTSTSSSLSLTDFSNNCRDYKLYGGVYGGSNQNCKDGISAGLKTAYYGYGTSTAYDMCSTCGSSWPSTTVFPTSKTTKNFLTAIKAGGYNGYTQSTAPVVPDTPSTDSGKSFYAYVNVHGYADYSDTTFKALTVENENSNTSNVLVATPDYKQTKTIWYFEYAGAADTYYIKNLKTGGYLCAAKTPANRVNVTTTASKTDNYTKWVFTTAQSASCYYQTQTTSISPVGYTSYYLHILRRTNTSVSANSVSYNAVLSNGSASTTSGNDGINYKADKNFLIEKIQTVNSDSEARIQNGETRLTQNSTALAFENAMDTSNTEYTSQFWRFVRTNENEYPPTYNIVNKKTGQYLSTNNTKGAGSLTADDRSGSDNQRWLLLSMRDKGVEEVRIIPYNDAANKYAYYLNDYNSSTGKGYTFADSDIISCLSVPTDSTTTPVLAKDDRSSKVKFNLEFVRTPVDLGDFYTLLHPYNNTGYAVSAGVDGKGNVTANGIGAVMRTVTDTPAIDQQWYFKSLGGGKYVIKNLGANTVLTATDSGAELTADNDDTAHRWYIIPEANGYSIVSAADTTLSAKNLNAASLANEGKLSLAAAGSNTVWDLDTSNTVEPAAAENLGESFFAYIFNPKLNGYLQCDNITTNEVGQVSKGSFVDTSKTDKDVTEATLSVVTADDKKRQTQENYWKFEHNADGSYTINSCNVQYSVMNAYADGAVKTVKKIATADIGTAYDSAYSQRWFIRKYGTTYRLEAKGNGKVLNFAAADTINYAENTQSVIGDDSVKQLCYIIKTDCSVDTEMPNVKINLFDYGKSINTYDKAVLPFTNGQNDYDKYVDGESGEDIVTIGTTTKKTPNGYNTYVRMSPTLNSAGYPQVTDNGRQYYTGKWTSDKLKNDDFLKDASGNPIGGSLEYLFNPKFAENYDNYSGYVQGYSTNDTYTKNDNKYQSQYFEVESPKGLFRVNPNNGMYYFDSLLGSAYFERNFDSDGKLTSNKGSFKLYDYTTSIIKADYRNNSKNSTTGLNLVSGNFFPFNLSCEEGDVFYGKERGAASDPELSPVSTSLDIGPRRRVKSTQTAVVDNGYVSIDDILPVNYRLSNSNTDENKKINAWFGMTMELEFQMTSDGTFNGKDMIYKFKGDDDVWVYIDDVLVLDMGGTHEAQTGTINFRTGAVDYTRNADVTDSNSLTADTSVATDLYSLFKAVNKTENVDATSKTFKPQTKHTLKFFYLERGGYVSGCQMQFNLPKGSVGVTKKVAGLDSELKDPRTYEFQVQNENGGAFSSSAISYTYEKADGTTAKVDTTDDCKFTLKDGESAVFDDFTDDSKYKIVELEKSSPTSTTNIAITEGSGTPSTVSGKDTGVLTAKSNVYTQITFTNTVPTSSVKLVTKVVDVDDVEIDEMADSTYYIGLHIFDSTYDYGTKTISVLGATELGDAKAKLISGLPVGTSYELWEYYPDDVSNEYLAPKLSDANGTKDFASKLIEKGTTPDSSVYITGSVSGQTLTVLNKIIPGNSVLVTFKYYDRAINNGAPAKIDDKETTYQKLADLTAYEAFVNNNNKISNVSLFKNVIADVGAFAHTNGIIDNVVDTYEIFTSQADAVNAVKGYTYTKGKTETENYAKHSITAEEAVYHTNSKRQPITDDAQKEKWVTYNQSGKIVDPENDTTVDLDKITEISVWLYNKPKTYKVTTHIPDENGNYTKQIEFEAYYNQQIGAYEGNDKQECESYCDYYSIPIEEYKARGVNKLNPANDTTNYETAGAPKKVGDNDFSYWVLGGSADTAPAANAPILSVDCAYMYRVTRDMHMYAVYGETVGKGVVSTNEGIDSYFDSNGIRKLRINTVMNPYGFDFGSSRGNKNIKYASVAYLTLKDSNTVLSDTQITNIKDTIKSTAAGLESTAKASGKATGSFNVEDRGTVIATVKVVVYDTDGGKLLTNKNRLHFVSSYTAPTGDNIKKVLAFTSMSYNYGTDDEPKNTWYVSDNYVEHTMTSK